jgi:DNA-binding winged helix-turn-helix (wHTH) protein
MMVREGEEFGASEQAPLHRRRTALAFLDFTWVNGTLARGGMPIKLTPKETRVLNRLLASAGNVVRAEDLLTAGWGDEPVGPESLNRCLTGLRRKAPTLCGHLQTHHRLGYCLAVEVRPMGDAGAGVDAHDVAAILRTAGRYVGLQSADCCASALRVLQNALESGIDRPELHAWITRIGLIRISNGHVAPKSGLATVQSSARRAGALLGPRTLSLLGMLQVAIDQDRTGIALVERACELAPDDAVNAVRHRLVHSIVNQAPLATTSDLELTGARSGNDFTAQAIFGMLRLLEGRIEEAHDLARRGISRFPFDHQLLALGALVESRLGDHAAAIDYGRSLCETRALGAGQGQCLLAFLLHRGGYADEAARVLAEATGEGRPFRPSAFAALAALVIEGGDACEAMLARARAIGCPHTHWLMRASGVRWPVAMRLAG